jgi:hypothetical protein
MGGLAPWGDLLHGGGVLDNVGHCLYRILTVRNSGDAGIEMPAVPAAAKPIDGLSRKLLQLVDHGEPPSCCCDIYKQLWGILECALPWSQSI